MKCACAIAGLLVLGAGFTRTGDAQEMRDSDEPATRFELTPFVGYQFGGAFDVQAPDQESSQQADVQAHASFALAFDLRADPELKYEFLYSRQPTRIEAEPAPGGAALNVEYLHLGGTAQFGESRLVKPYSVGTLGVTRLSIDSAGASDETAFSLGLGIGLRVPMRDRLDLRLEARAFVTFLNTDSSLFCASGAAGASCVLHGSGSTFTQFALLAGAAFAF